MEEELLRLDIVKSDALLEEEITQEEQNCLLEQCKKMDCKEVEAFRNWVNVLTIAFAFFCGRKCSGELISY